jgi:anthranilate synthase component 1
MITFEQFQTAAQTHNVIPLTKTVLADMHTPVSLYLAYREERKQSFLLESVEPNERVGRFSFIGSTPVMTLTARGDQIEIRNNTAPKHRTGNIINVLKEYSSQYRQYHVPELEGFSGGFLGYMGYDYVSQFERISLQSKSPFDQPDAMFALFESIVKFDHRNHVITIIQNIFIDLSQSLQRQYEEGKQKLETSLQRLFSLATPQDQFQCELERMEGNGADEYMNMVKRAKHYIHEGDIFQVVLSRRTSIPYSGDPFPVYRALRFINPSPYLFYIDFDFIKLIGSSPEILVRVLNKQVELFPIAGTRKRGATEEEDQMLEQELLADEKELAEHHMLIDLGRNDVGRVSELSSVHVPVNKRVDRYSHVMHIVSEVHGKLRADQTSIDALQACFPAGTVSGAPKVRAMEIISELEPSCRGIYAGAVGYVGFDGTLDMCIAIRTIVADNNKLYLQAGAGIVADSVPETEYRETKSKAQVLIDAIKLAANNFEFDSSERGAK